jgi:transcriptional regulator with XRE-family HTH domain
MDAVRFGAILRRIRVERGWTRQKLATRSGMTPQYLSILEQGGNVPSLSTVLELIEVLGADRRGHARARGGPHDTDPPLLSGVVTFTCLSAPFARR